MFRQSILIVDDEVFNIKVVKYALSSLDVEILEAGGGNDALNILSRRSVDLVLLDLMMPDMNGFEVLQELKERGTLHTTSVIILTAIQESKEKVQALELGAIDYTTKPFVRAELMARIKIHLSLRRYQRSLNQHAQTLEGLVKERTKELLETQDVVAFSLARLAESRDPETGDHLERMSRYSGILAEALVGNSSLDQPVDKEYAATLEKVAVLHDIGKVGIPDHILLKPGRLTKEEFEYMKRHAVYGGDTLRDANKRLQKPVPYLSIAAEVAYFHHEKWNGKGYPEGRRGTEIPLSARIVALADVYDALRSKRIYKPAFSHEKTRSIIIEERGEHFQPEVVDAFLACEEQFVAIAEQFKPPET